MATLYNYIVQGNEERGKTTRGKSSLKKGHEKNTKNAELMVLLLLQTKLWCLEEYSSWEEENISHLDQEQLLDGIWDHVEQVKSNDV